MPAWRRLLVTLAAVIPLVALACHSDTPSQPSCTYSLSLTTNTFAASGGQGAISVATGTACTWAVAADSTWVSFPAGSGGSGPATIAFAVAANAATDARQATLTVAGQPLAVKQDGRAACEYTVSPASLDLVAAGGSATVTVTTASGCSWVATAAAPWATITSGAAGTGNGTVTLAVAANTAAEERQTSVTVASRAVAVHQTGTPPPPPQPVECEYQVSPVDTVVHWHITSVAISISTSAGCTWTASPSDGWLSIDRTDGSGPATITASFPVFTENASRSAVVKVRWPLPSLGQNAKVTQEGCGYGFEEAASMPAAGGTRMLTVVTQPVSATCGRGECPWTATSNASWIHVTSSMPRAGDDMFSYLVDPNTGATRVGTITIAGRTHTVTQAGS